MIVPALRRATDLPMQAIVATSLAVIALVSASGVIAAAAGGHLEWRIALPFTLAAVAGMLAGRAVADRFPPRRLQQSFALFAAAGGAGQGAERAGGLRRGRPRPPPDAPIRRSARRR